MKMSALSFFVGTYQKDLFLKLEEIIWEKVNM